MEIEKIAGGKKRLAKIRPRALARFGLAGIGGILRNEEFRGELALGRVRLPAGHKEKCAVDPRGLVGATFALEAPGRN